VKIISICPSIHLHNFLWTRCNKTNVCCISYFILHLQTEWLYVGSDAEAVDEDDTNDPEYNIMQDDVTNEDDEDNEEIRNDKATRVSSMFTTTFTFCFSLFASFFARAVWNGA